MKSSDEMLPHPLDDSEASAGTDLVEKSTGQNLSGCQYTNQNLNKIIFILMLLVLLFFF
jgi:hypothetical protein